MSGLVYKVVLSMTRSSKTSYQTLLLRNDLLSEERRRRTIRWLEKAYSRFYINIDSKFKSASIVIRSCKHFDADKIVLTCQVLRSAVFRQQSHPELMTTQ